MPLVGTVERVADVMEEAMEQVGGDGFMFNGAYSAVARLCRGDCRRAGAGTAKRGLVRTAYAHAHFRGNLFAFRA